MDTITEELINAAKTVNKFSLEGEYKKALVTDVYDGDTITVVFKHFNKINLWKIRLLGINTPELRPSRLLDNRDKVIIAAKKARDYLSEMILNKIVYVYCGKFDNFGRILGTIYLNKTELIEGLFEKSINNKMLVSENAIEY
jgi:endonuclease YncB( thermonuclease family)